MKESKLNSYLSTTSRHLQTSHPRCSGQNLWALVLLSHPTYRQNLPLSSLWPCHCTSGPTHWPPPGSPCSAFAPELLPMFKSYGIMLKPISASLSAQSPLKVPQSFKVRAWRPAPASLSPRPSGSSVRRLRRPPQLGRHTPAQPSPSEVHLPLGQPLLTRHTHHQHSRPCCPFLLYHKALISNLRPRLNTHLV